MGGGMGSGMERAEVVPLMGLCEQDWHLGGGKMEWL